MSDQARMTVPAGAPTIGFDIKSEVGVGTDITMIFNI